MQAQSATGRLVRIENMPSQHVAPRHIDIWPPDNFDTLKNQGQKFNVIYMHDGQILFAARTTWNKQAWNVDQTLTRLMRSGQLAPTRLNGLRD